MKNAKNKKAGTPPVLNASNPPATPGVLYAGEFQPDLDEDGNGYCWPITALTKEQREKSIPGRDYVQNPAYCNSEETAKRMAAAWNACEGLDTDILSRLKPGALKLLLEQRAELLSACKAMRDGWEGNLTEPMRFVNEALTNAGE